MYKRVFLDANVIADIYDASRLFHEPSDRAVTALTNDPDVTLFTSCDIITTLYYILAKSDKKKALDAIVQINDLCHVVEFGNEEIAESCRLMQQNRGFVDLEDTIQYVMAKKKNCDLILSNDTGFVSEEMELLRTHEYGQQQ